MEITMWMNCLIVLILLHYSVGKCHHHHHHRSHDSCGSTCESQKGVCMSGSCTSDPSQPNLTPFAKGTCCAPKVCCINCDFVCVLKGGQCYDKTAYTCNQELGNLCTRCHGDSGCCAKGHTIPKHG